VIVENAGFGAASAAPIARRVFDYVLMNQYPNEDDLAAVSKGQATAPIGKPRVASEVPWPPKPIITAASAGAAPVVPGGVDAVMTPVAVASAPVVAASAARAASAPAIPPTSPTPAAPAKAASTSR